MRNTKEIRAILTAIYCINRIGNQDEDIEKILRYAFQRILDTNTNLLILACAGRTKKDAMPEIIQVLKEDTKLVLDEE